MPITIKAFASNAGLKNNSPGVTARFGELSGNSRTYSREVREYATFAYPLIELQVFSSKSATGEDQELGMNYSDQLLEITNWCYQRGSLVNGNTTVQDFVAALENNFEGTITELTAGPLVSNAVTRMPSKLVFTMTPHQKPPASVTVWFCDTEFAAEYDEYEIVVVQPVPVLNVFFQTREAIKTALAARPVDLMLALVEEAKKGRPTTRIASQTVRWYNPNSQEDTIEATWFVLIYGVRGNTADAINKAIADSILSLSTQLESNWKLVLPDLFRITRFYVVPRWSDYAIPDRTSIAGIYSPTVNFAAGLEEFASYFDNVVDDTFATSLEFTHHPFRSIGLLVLAGRDNRDGATSLKGFISDYIGQESLSEDFNRQSDATQQWITTMGSALRTAETYGISSNVLPIGVDLTVENGHTCMRTKVLGVEFVVLCRSATVV